MAFASLPAPRSWEEQEAHYEEEMSKVQAQYLADYFENGVADAANAVQYLNPHPPQSQAWHAYHDGYHHSRG